MSFIGKLQKGLADAKVAGDKQKISRLVRMIGLEERKARTRAANEEEQRRKTREEFLPRSKSSSASPKSRGGFSRNLPPMGFFNDFVDETEKEEAERAAKARAAAEEARRQEELRKEAQRRAAEDQRRRERARQERAKFRQEQQSNDRRQKKNSARSQQQPAPSAPVSMPQITAWRTFCGNCFDNTSSGENAYAKILTFPTPPGGCCGQLKCVQENRDRLNKACDCNIRRAVRLAGVASAKEARKEMTKWHPDKFSACVEEKRKGFQKMANEVFVVLSQVARGG